MSGLPGAETRVQPRDLEPGDSMVVETLDGDLRAVDHLALVRTVEHIGRGRYRILLADETKYRYAHARDRLRVVRLTDAAMPDDLCARCSEIVPPGEECPECGLVNDKETPL